MLLISCPYCAMARPELEFRNMGEAHIARPLEPAATSDADWAEFLYLRSNTRGILLERWRHSHGCGRFFNAARDTVSDRFLATYKAGESCPPGIVASEEHAAQKWNPVLRNSMRPNEKSEKDA